MEFENAGFLGAGDQPELFFFRFNSERIGVAISGSSLDEWQHEHRRLSRKDKIDAPKLWVQQKLEAGKTLIAENSYIQAAELDESVASAGPVEVRHK